MIKKVVNSLIQFWKTTPLYLQIFFLLVLGIAIYLAVIGLQAGIIFSYDQARDAIEAKSIWHDHHIKILGPSTDIPGVFHGVLWYYLLAVVYFIGRSPEFTASVFCVFLFLTTPFVGWLTEELFKNRKTTIIAMVLYMLSSLFQTASHWLSNPILSFFVSPVLLILIWRFVKKPTVLRAFLIGISYGLLIQADFSFLLFLLTIPLYWIGLRLSWNIKYIVALLVGILIGVSSFLIAEVKFHGQTVQGIETFLQKGSPHHTFLVTLSQIWVRLSEFATVTFASFPKNIVSLLLIVLILFSVFQLKGTYRKQMILLLGWLGILVIFLLSGTGIATSYFVFFPFVIVLTLLVSFTITKLGRYTIIILFITCICVISQIVKSHEYIKTNITPLAVQQGGTLNLEEQVMNYSYQASNKMPFTIVTITNPLYIDTTWAYLYSQYGLSHFGYIPNYGGRGQTNLPGEFLLPEVLFATHYRYLIEEPPDGLATIYITKIIYEEDKVSNVVETKHIGRYIIQKRVLVHNKPLPPVPQELQGKPILNE